MRYQCMHDGCAGKAVMFFSFEVDSYRYNVCSLEHAQALLARIQERHAAKREKKPWHSTSPLEA